MKYKEIICDVTTKMPEYVTAHCISEDCAMGAGVVMAFRKVFPYLKEACKSYVKEVKGEYSKLHYKDKGYLSADKVLPPYRYTDNSKTVYNLFTKKLYWHNARKKMTYEQYKRNLEISLCALRDDMISRGEAKLAMPKICTGLDRCMWIDVKEIIYKVFSESEIEICICLWDK